MEEFVRDIFRDLNTHIEGMVFKSVHFFHYDRFIEDYFP